MGAPQITQIGLRFSRLIKILTYTRHQFTKKKSYPRPGGKWLPCDTCAQKPFLFFLLLLKPEGPYFSWQERAWDISSSSLGFLSLVAQFSFGPVGSLGTESGPLPDSQLPSWFLEIRSGSRKTRAHPGRVAQRAGSLAPTASALLFRRLELGRSGYCSERVTGWTLAPGGRRGQALFPSAQRGPSLLCHCRAQGQARGLKLSWPSEGEGASEGTCLRRGPRAPHSAGSAWVESMGNPAGLRCGHTGPAAALGLPRNHTELLLLPWWRRGVCSHRRGSRHPLSPVRCCSSLSWNPSHALFQPFSCSLWDAPGQVLPWHLLYACGRLGALLLRPMVF